MDKAAKSMSTSIRHSMRPEALKAKSRITEYCKIDMTNSDSDESTTSSPSDPSPSDPSPSDPSPSDDIQYPLEAKYKYTAHVIRYLIDECNKAQFEDQRIQIVEKMFHHLIDNPSILIYEPKFRISVINKMKEIETHIHNRNKLYYSAKYNSILLAIRNSIRLNMRNSVMREKLYKHFNGINSTLAEYEEWSAAESLLKKTSELYNILESIKKSAYYVPYSEDTY
jgi:hypothetical protein